jgi:hypothetical protein
MEFLKAGSGTSFKVVVIAKRILEIKRENKVSNFGR